MNKWTHVLDGLPPEMKNVLVYIERNALKGGKCIRKKEIAIGWHIGGSWHVDGCSGVVCMAWMPLPKKPTIKEALKRVDKDGNDYEGSTADAVAKQT